MDLPSLLDRVARAMEDLVSEITTEPWPSIVVNGRRGMAILDEDDLDMWYGDRRAPVLRLPTIRLADDAG